MLVIRKFKIFIHFKCVSRLGISTNVASLNISFRKIIIIQNNCLEIITSEIIIFKIKFYFKITAI